MKITHVLPLNEAFEVSRLGVARNPAKSLALTFHLFDDGTMMVAIRDGQMPLQCAFFREITALKSFLDRYGSTSWLAWEDKESAQRYPVLVDVIKVGLQICKPEPAPLAQAA